MGAMHDLQPRIRERSQASRASLMSALTTPQKRGSAKPLHECKVELRGRVCARPSAMQISTISEERDAYRHSMHTVASRWLRILRTASGSGPLSGLHHQILIWQNTEQMALVNLSKQSFQLLSKSSKRLESSGS